MTDPNKGLITCSYQGDNHYVLGALLVIGTTNYERIASITSRGVIKDHHSGLITVNDNRSGLSINFQTC